MYKRSILLVLLILTVVFVSSFTSQMVSTRNLPSSYDPGLGIEQAFKTAKTPLLVEFYSDTCGACKRIAPIVHEVATTTFSGKLTLVMLDVDDSQNYQVAQIFGVDALPSVYLFDFHHMKKHQINVRDLTSSETLNSALNTTLTQIANTQAPVRFAGNS